MKGHTSHHDGSMYAQVALSLMTAIVVPVLLMFYHAGYFDVVKPVEKLRSYTPSPWPPIVGQRYPDLDLIDQNGRPFKISNLRGRVIIVEPIGMNCPACQAFSGGHHYGAYENNPVQQYVKSFKEIFPLYAKGLKLPSRDVVFVQLLLYDMNLEPPRPKDAMEWAKHFQMDPRENFYVAVSPYDLRSDASFKMIPGFHLIDKNLIMRADSSGHNPKHDLYRQLIPFVPKLVRAPLDWGGR